MAQTTEPQRGEISIIQERQTGQAVVVRLRGSAGMQQADRVKARLREIAQGRPSLVVLDLGELSFIYSEGLEAILHCHVVLSRLCGGHVCIANASCHVARVFQIARLDKLFPMFGSVDDALRAYPAGAGSGR